MDRQAQDQQDQARREIRNRLTRLAFLITHIILSSVIAILSSVYTNQPEQYHTSILIGQGWVLELLTGHSERICCKLGLHRHVFLNLISELCEMGHADSRFVSLEEQLAIFLYCCVTGLTICHVGEHFQRSNETISK